MYFETTRKRKLVEQINRCLKKCREIEIEHEIAQLLDIVEKSDDSTKIVEAAITLKKFFNSIKITDAQKLIIKLLSKPLIDDPNHCFTAISCLMRFKPFMYDSQKHKLLSAIIFQSLREQFPISSGAFREDTNWVRYEIVLRKLIPSTDKVVIKGCQSILLELLSDFTFAHDSLTHIVDRRFQRLIQILVIIQANVADEDACCIAIEARKKFEQLQVRPNRNEYGLPCLVVQLFEKPALMEAALKDINKDTFKQKIIALGDADKRIMGTNFLRSLLGDGAVAVEEPSNSFRPA